MCVYLSVGYDVSTTMYYPFKPSVAGEARDVINKTVGWALNFKVFFVFNIYFM